MVIDTETILVSKVDVTPARRIAFIFGSPRQIVTFIISFIMFNLVLYLFWGRHNASYNLTLPIFVFFGGLPAIYRSRPMRILVISQQSMISAAQIRKKIETLNYDLKSKAFGREVYILQSLPRILLWREQNIILETEGQHVLITAPAYLTKKIECWFRTDIFAHFQDKLV